MSYFLPTRLLQINVSDIQPYATWNETDSSDPFVGFPWQWTVTMTVNAQTHSSGHTRVPFTYTGLDVQVGDWFSTQIGGLAVQIIQIISADDGNLVVIAEDVDRINTLTDPTQNGTGISQAGPGLIFQLDEDGNPLLSPMPPNYLPETFQTDLIGRFQYRNSFKNFIDINQPGHGLSEGDMIYLDSDGNYKQIVANETNRDKLLSIVGQVSSISVPGVDWFSYRVRGEFKNSISPPLPDCAPGSIIYIDPTTPGALTATKPSEYATPVYIRLDSNTRGINIEGQETVVPEVDKDPEITITPSSQATTLIKDLYEGDTVFLITVEVTTAFDGVEASLNIGSSDNNSLLMSDNELDLSSVGNYQTSSQFKMTNSSGNLPINAYFNSNGSTVGSATITLSFN